MVHHFQKGTLQKVLYGDKKSSVGVQLIAELLIGVPDQIDTVTALQGGVRLSAQQAGGEGVGHIHQMLYGIAPNGPPGHGITVFQPQYEKGGIAPPMLRRLDRRAGSWGGGLQNQPRLSIHYDPGMPMPPPKGVDAGGDENIPILQRGEGMEQALLQVLLPEEEPAGGADRRGGKRQMAMGPRLEQSSPREAEEEGEEKGQDSDSYFFRKIPSFCTWTSLTNHKVHKRKRRRGFMESRLEDLRLKEVIDGADGSRYGYVGDVELDWETGKIKALIIPGRLRLFGLLGREEDMVIPFEAVRRFGEDIILVELGEEESRPLQGKRKNEKDLAKQEMM